MDVRRHWSGESLHAHLLYDGDIADAWMPWHHLSENWRLKWEGIAVLLNSDRGAVVIDDAAVERAARALATDNEEAAAWDLCVETARLALHAAAGGQCAAHPRGKEQP